MRRSKELCSAGLSELSVETLGVLRPFLLTLIFSLSQFPFTCCVVLLLDLGPSFVDKTHPLFPVSCPLGAAIRCSVASYCQ